MTSKRKNKSKKRPGNRYYYILAHRWIGISSAFIIILLSITGFMLNHTQELDMNKQYISSTTILSWYGIKMPKQNTYIENNKNWIVQIGKQLYFNKVNIKENASKLLAVINKNEMIIVVLTHRILLLTEEGLLIEELNAQNGLPLPISDIAVDGKQQLLINVDNKQYISDDDLLNWSQIKNSNIIKSNINIFLPQALPRSLISIYQQIYLGKNISLERFVLDLHSGRFFGTLGVYLVDLISLFILFLAFSGAWLWYKRYVR